MKSLNEIIRDFSLIYGNVLQGAVINVNSSLIAVALLVFVAAALCYGIPSIIGAPGQIYTVTTRIIDYVQIGNDEGLTHATCLRRLSHGGRIDNFVRVEFHRRKKRVHYRVGKIDASVHRRFGKSFPS